MSDASASIEEVKTVIRCRDYDASLDFYHHLLGFPIIEQWEEEDGTGCIFAPVVGTSVGCIEIYEMRASAARWDSTFSDAITSDKIDIQLRTPDLQSWIDRLNGRWSFSDPETTPWGHSWIRLRDPDNLQIAIYEVIA